MRIPGTPTDGVSLTVLADALAPYATISSVNSALNTKLNTTGGAVSGLLSFSGLDSVGVRLKSLTAAQYGNLTPANGDIYLDTTTNRIDARVGGTTREVIDSFGGQQIGGNLNLSGTGNLIATGVGEFGDGTGLRYMLVNGANSGTTTGAAVRVQNDGVDIGLFGNLSAVVGGAYNPSFVIRSGAALGFYANNAATPNIWLGTNGNLGLGTGTATVTGGLLQVGDGTGTRYLAINGANSGTTGGSALRIQNNGADIGTLGNASAILGGAYNSNFLMRATGSAIIDSTAGAVILRTGGFDRWQIGANHWYPSVTNAYDLGLSTNRVRDLYVGGINATGTITGGVITGSTSLNTNSISRNTPTATLTLGFGSMPTGFHSVTIGGGGSLTNSTGIAGYLRLDSIINQTGTAGSADIVVNRTETALGSGTHRFMDFQINTQTRWYVDREGSQFFCNGADSTRVFRQSGTGGRLTIYRPNNPAAIAVQFGGGNDELYIGQSGEGSFRASGGGVTVGSAATLLLDSATNSFTFRGSASTTMATLTGAGNLNLIGELQLSTDTRMQRSAQALTTQVFDTSLAAWQTTSRQEASATGARWSVLGATPIVRQTHAAVATDLATAITRLNTLCTHLTNFGLFN